MPASVLAPSPMFCLKCSYDLQGLTEPRCPECGRPFDPGNPATFSIRPIGRFGRYLLKPPGWLLQMYAVLCAACSLWFVSSPALVWLGYIFGALTWGPLAVFWWVRLVAYVGARLNYCPGRRETITAVCRWLWAPGLFLLVALLVRADVPISARFRLSLPDMEQLRLQAIAQQTPSPHPTGPRMTQMFAVLPSQKVGLFWIKQAVAVDGDFQLWLIDQDLRWSYRFEYLKDDPSPPCAKDGEWHTVHERSADRRWIQGNWYLWRNVP